jgi:hypothetical protein
VSRKLKIFLFLTVKIYFSKLSKFQKVWQKTGWCVAAQKVWETLCVTRNDSEGPQREKQIEKLELKETFFAVIGH